MIGGMGIRLEYVEKRIEKEFKKLYWAEKADKATTAAVEKLLKKLDELEDKKYFHGSDKKLALKAK